MSIVPTIKGVSFRKAAISFVLVGFTIIAFASIGGGNSRSKNNLVSANIAPLRSNRGFSLKTGMNYRGSMLLREERSSNNIYINSLTIYQKGNATYIIPNKYRLSVAPNTSRSNLQMVNLKFKLCK